MPQLRRYLLSSSQESRKELNSRLLSSMDRESLVVAFAGFSPIEKSLEGELKALIAAAAGEPQALTMGRRTHIVCGRLGLLSGQITGYSDLARKLDVTPNTAGDHCRTVLIRLAQASLAGALPYIPYLSGLRSLLDADVRGKWLEDGARFPESIGCSGMLTPMLAALIGWDVLRWQLPRVYSRVLYEEASKFMPDASTPFRNYDSPSGASEQAVLDPS